MDNSAENLPKNHSSILNIKEKLISEPLFTIPNIISSVRVMALPVFIYYGKKLSSNTNDINTYYLVISLFFLAILSDFLDGFLARLYQQESVFGKYLDPVSDKIVTLISICLLVKFFCFPIWVLVCLIIREIIGVFVGTYLFFKHGIQGEPNIWGKLGVFLIALNIFIYLSDATFNWKLIYVKEISYTSLVMVYGIGSISYILKYEKYFKN
jgi:CDP-diacylglycerol--glycerol-3-phosphate 3-phosphatidyltransferase